MYTTEVFTLVMFIWLALHIYANFTFRKLKYQKQATKMEVLDTFFISFSSDTELIKPIRHSWQDGSVSRVRRCEQYVTAKFNKYGVQTSSLADKLCRRNIQTMRGHKDQLSCILFATACIMCTVQEWNWHKKEI